MILVAFAHNAFCFFMSIKIYVIRIDLQSILMLGTELFPSIFPHILHYIPTGFMHEQSFIIKNIKIAQTAFYNL